jgi:PhzF family phenazine biosynthesis protein
LEKWLPDELMQKLAAENNLSETAFFVKEGEGYDLRWFTPEFEIDLCGHATLASAFVLFNHLDYSSDVIKFSTKSGVLEVRKKGDLIELNFPSRMPQPCAAPKALLKGVNIPPAKVLKSRDYFLVYEDEALIKQIVPDFNYLNKVDTVGVIASAASAAHHKPGNIMQKNKRYFLLIAIHNKPCCFIGTVIINYSTHLHFTFFILYYKPLVCYNSSRPSVYSGIAT